MAKEPTAYQLTAAMTALLQVKERLLAEDPDIVEDSLLLQNLLEGDLATGDYMEVVHRVLQAAVQADDFASMLKDRMKRIGERAARWQARSVALRNGAMNAMGALELRKLQFDDITATVAVGAPSVVVTDEESLPDEFFRVRREPNKMAIAAALKGGADIAGVSMSNAADSLRIKTT